MEVGTGALESAHDVHDACAEVLPAIAEDLRTPTAQVVGVYGQRLKPIHHRTDPGLPVGPSSAGRVVLRTEPLYGRDPATWRPSAEVPTLHGVRPRLMRTARH